MTDLRRNRVLAAMPQAALTRLRPHLQVVSLEQQALVHEAGAAVSHALFPLDAVFSLVSILKSGAPAEAAIVGREGVVGLWSCMGGTPTGLEAVVQASGKALRMPSARFADEFDRNHAFRTCVLRYNVAITAQIIQTAVCHRHHSARQQLARWLLMMCDRSGRNELRVTQDGMAEVLGAGRPTISKAASELQRHGAIRYARGRLKVAAAARLRACACECYGTIAKEYDRLLGAERR